MTGIIYIFGCWYDADWWLFQQLCAMPLFPVECPWNAASQEKGRGAAEAAALQSSQKLITSISGKCSSHHPEV